MSEFFKESLTALNQLEVIVYLIYIPTKTVRMFLPSKDQPDLSRYGARNCYKILQVPERDQPNNALFRGTGIAEVENEY